MTRNNDDTICAIATAPGGAIGIIRVSGNGAVAAADKIFRPLGNDKRRLAQRQPYTVAFGRIVDDRGEAVDEVLASVFRAPHSYTGDDSVELSCHGSSYILQRVMQLLIGSGCRSAGPGEFTQRAFLNGKMDLSQAEAVADLIASSNKATHDVAMRQLRGSFSSELSRLRAQLLKLTSLLELELDFSDQDVSFADRNVLLDLARQTDRRITSLAASFATGKALKEGIPVAIIGKTNVGKSTLLNALVGDEKAIVSDIHGTTRDVIEDTTQIGGLTFRFIDTAGLRKTDDRIEQMGIERTYRKMDEAAIIVWVVDITPSDSELADIRRLAEGKKLIIADNKIDTPDTPPHFAEHIGQTATVAISAKLGRGIGELEQAIYEAADIPEIGENDIIVTSTRHHEALLRAHESISRVIEGIASDLSGDLLSEDLRQTIDDLGDITGGTITPQETLNSIFAHFCIGK